VDTEQYLFGLGVAPTVRLVEYKRTNCLVNESGLWNPMVKVANVRGANVINMSFNIRGDDGGCGYTNDSHITDYFARQGILSTVSAGNASEGCSPVSYVRAPATAKDAIAVGASDNFTYPWSNNPAPAPTCHWCEFLPNLQPPVPQNARRIPSFSGVRDPLSLVKPDLVAPA